MPASLTFLQTCILLWSTFVDWTNSVPLKRDDDCPGYKASNVQNTDGGITADLTLAGSECNIYGVDLHDLKFVAEYQTDSRVHVMIYDKDEEVNQIPESIVPQPTDSTTSDTSQLDVSIEEEPFSFTVTRKSNKEVIFTTKGSNIVFENQYVRFRTTLPENPNLYGLGEHTDPMKLPTSNYIRTLWNKDAGAVPQNTNLYGTHPVYYEYRAESGNSHGVYLRNSNGMDIKINNDNGQYLEYNIIGGVIDLHFMAGPTAFDVAREYSDVSGRAAMMPYWGFGFHQCRWGISGVDYLEAVVANYSAANIPLETLWTDIDYMDNNKVFSLGPNFPIDRMRSLIGNLHSNDQHYIVMVDPAVAYQDYGAFNDGVEADVFMKRDNGSIYKGSVWPGVAAFPDWFHENAQSYWNGQFDSFFNADTGVDIDALWIDMNEPSNFCVWPCDNPDAPTSELSAPPRRSLSPRQSAGSKKGLPGRNLTFPPYAIHSANLVLGNKTMNTELIHQGGWAEYDVHNLYGTMMSKTSQQAMLNRRPGKRPMVITRSTFAGAGQYVGHWLGDNVSRWDQYVYSIRHLLQFVAYYQLPMVGADVCGFLEDTTENLCARWMVLGAFYPFYRNHNVAGAIAQEAYRWESVATAARKAIDLRYRLLDYIYTAMYEQNQIGTPMLAPLWMHYPNDSATHAIDVQFFYGPSLLVSPVTQQDSTSVTFYLPNDIFYDLFTLKQVNNSGSQITYTDLKTSDIPVHIKGGSIVPARVSSANTTTAVRDNDFELLIATDANGNAKGNLYLDDGINIDQAGVSEIKFSFSGSTIKSEGTYDFKTQVGVKSITVLGKSGANKYELNEGLDGPWEHDIGSLQHTSM